MKFGSLFAGVGGFDIGMENAGYECQWQVEWDPSCQQTLLYHWPHVPKWGDVSNVNGADLAPVDVITFGSPCQDLSVAGRRAGLDGDRSKLFFEATRIIKEMQDATRGAFPRYAIWENVAGALTSRNGDDFEAVLKEMAQLGAHFIEWAVLDAQFFGVPQRRRRVFVVTCFDPAIAERSGTKILNVSEGRRRHNAKGKSAGQGTSGALAESTGGSGEPGDGIDNTIFSFDTQFGSNAAVFEDLSPTLKSSQQPPSICASDLTPRSELATGPGVANCISAGIYHNLSVVNQDIDQGHLVIEERPIIIDRAAFNQGQNALYDVQIEEVDVCPSLVARGPHGVAFRRPNTEMNVRRLTPLECERLMGWPDDHTKYRADGKINSQTVRYKMCGNGVASPVAQWIAEQIIKLEQHARS